MGNKPRTINVLPASGTNGTKRDKREILKLDTSGTHGTTPPIGGCPCPAAPDLQKTLDLLRAEVVIYLNTYISRGYHAEGVALARLRKAAEGNWPAPSPGSPGSPEREAEQGIRNERATRMVKKLEELFDNQS